jgi:hypothetical protein
MEQPAPDAAARDQTSSVRYTKLLELFRKFLQGALQCPSQQVRTAHTAAAARTAGRDLIALHVPCARRRGSSRRSRACTRR